MKRSSHSRHQWFGQRLLLLLGVFLGMNATAEWRTENHEAMGTQISVSVWSEDAIVAKQAIASVMAEMNRIEQTYSPYIETSALSQLNQKAALAPQAISSEMQLLLESSANVSQLTDGAFDITFASVGHLYDYRQQQQPSDRELADLKEAIDYRFVLIQDNTVFFKHPNVKIDLGGIAKGYAVDQAVAILQAQGIVNASVSAGGDSRLLGDRRGRPWLVGVKNPRANTIVGDKDDVALRIPLSNAAVSTSGDYERYFIDETTQERVHHIVNPRSGKSVQGVTSVTIIGEAGLQTDPLSTSVFVLGVEKGLALIDRLDKIDVIIIDRFGKVHYSEGLTP